MPTVLHRLERWAQEVPAAEAQRFKKGGTWKAISSRELRDRVYYLALFMASRGLTRTDVAAVLSPNCPQWVQFDLAALLLGAKSAGLYPNSNSKDILYILEHTEAKILAVKDREFFEKVQAPSRIHTIVVFEGDASFSPHAVSYKDALAEGKKLAAIPGAKSMSQYLEQLDPHAGAFMIYTSGTTGNPKGALLSHDNLVFTSDVVSEYWHLPRGRGSLFSFLPLCHIAEKLQNVGVGISNRYTVNFCTRFENVSTELPEVQPTLLLCVPRLWEKMMEGVLQKIKTGQGAKKKLALWALDVGARVASARYAGKRASPLDLVQLRIADKLVLSKVRHALGLGKAETLASGAAALPAHVSRWFRSLQLEILEDFGQTESTGVICMTQPGVESAGTVGKPLPGIDVRIAEDGEVLAKGRNVFKGYFKEEAATAQTLEGGWLHTGDLAEINEHGLMKIRGRKKEILKTSGGKMVAPLPIEEALKAAPLISQVCMVGDGRKFLSALITLSESTLADLKSRGVIGTDGGDRVLHAPDILGEVKKFVDETNRSLSSFEQIKNFVVLSREFSILDGEMTPTLKMKRNVIEDRFRALIDEMYR